MATPKKRGSEPGIRLAMLVTEQENLYPMGPGVSSCMTVAASRWREMLKISNEVLGAQKPPLRRVCANCKSKRALNADKLCASCVKAGVEAGSW